MCTMELPAEIMGEHSNKCRRVLELKRELAVVNNWLINKCEWAKEHINKIGFDLLVAKSEKPVAGGPFNKLRTTQFPEEVRSVAAIHTKLQKYVSSNPNHVPKLSRGQNNAKLHKFMNQGSQEQVSLNDQQQPAHSRKRHSALNPSSPGQKILADALATQFKSDFLRAIAPSETKSRQDNTPRFSHFRDKYKKDSANSPAAQLSSSCSESGSLDSSRKLNEYQFSPGMSAPSPTKILGTARSEFGIQFARERVVEDLTPNQSKELQLFGKSKQVEWSGKPVYSTSHPTDLSIEFPPRITAEEVQRAQVSDTQIEGQGDKNSKSSHSRYTGAAKNKLIKAVQRLELNNRDRGEDVVEIKIPVCSIAKSSFGDRSDPSSDHIEQLRRDSDLDMVAKEVPDSVDLASEDQASLAEFRKQARDDPKQRAAKPMGKIMRMPTGYFSDEGMDAPETGPSPYFEPQAPDLKKMKTICKEFFTKMHEYARVTQVWRPHEDQEPLRRESASRHRVLALPARDRRPRPVRRAQSKGPGQLVVGEARAPVQDHRLDARSRC